MNVPSIFESIRLIRDGADQTIRLERARRYLGESDDQHTARTEYAFRDRLFAAAAELEAVIDAINHPDTGSSIMKIDKDGFQIWRHDNCVASREYWDSKISEAQ